MGDWPIFIALAGAALGGLSLLARLLDKGLTIREHEEFKRAIQDQIINIIRNQEARLVIREFQEWVMQFRIDLEHIRDEISRLDTTKPTTGELDRTSRALEARLEIVEAVVRARITELKEKGLT